MFLNEDQAQERLQSDNNLANRFGKRSITAPVRIQEEVIQRPGKSRENLTVDERTEIAIRSKLGEKGTQLASEFGITPGNVSHIKTGRNPNVEDATVEATITQVRDKALDRLMSSLNLLSPDKLSGCSAKDLSVIASNMGRVVEKTLPKSDSPDKITFVIYAPELRKESSFDVIEVGS